MVGSEFLNSQGVIPIAHRGGMGEKPQNTFEAFHHATQLGYKYIDLDARATTGGGIEDVYVWHGQGLAEILLTRRPLKMDRIKVVGQLSELDSRDAAVPRLVDVLEEFPDTKFMVEPKNWPVVRPLAKVVQATKSAHRISVGSFSHAMTQAVRKEIWELTRQKIYTSMAPHAVAGLVMRGCFFPNRSWMSVYDSVHLPPALVTRKCVDTARSAGLSVFSATVNSTDAMRRMLDEGVDGLLTDYPSRLKSILQERRQWLKPD